MAEHYSYSKQDPPPSCYECDYHTFTYSPITKCHTMWSDYCSHLRKAFGKLHIVLRGEYRSLAKHDEDDLKKHLPFECPYFDDSRLYWEMYGIIQMDKEVFVFECDTHFMDYYGWYVYSLSDNIDYVKSNVSERVGLNYLVVQSNDVSWFIQNFGENVVLLSEFSPSDWHYPVPPQPI